MAGYRAIRFDELEDVPWKPGLTLRPVRSQLGLRGRSAAAGSRAHMARRGGPPAFTLASSRGAAARRRLDEAIEREPDLRREALSDPLLSSLF